MSWFSVLLFFFILCRYRQAAGQSEAVRAVGSGTTKTTGGSPKATTRTATAKKLTVEEEVTVHGTDFESSNSEEIVIGARITVLE